MARRGGGSKVRTAQSGQSWGTMNHIGSYLDYNLRMKRPCSFCQFEINTPPTLTDLQTFPESQAGEILRVTMIRFSKTTPPIPRFPKISEDVLRISLAIPLCVLPNIYLSGTLSPSTDSSLQLFRKCEKFVWRRKLAIEQCRYIICKTETGVWEFEG